MMKVLELPALDSAQCQDEWLRLCCKKVKVPVPEITPVLSKTSAKDRNPCSDLLP